MTVFCVRQIVRKQEVSFVVKMYLMASGRQLRELKEHLLYNGYHVKWRLNCIICVDKEDVAYVQTILKDRGIEFVDAHRVVKCRERLKDYLA